MSDNGLPKGTHYPTYNVMDQQEHWDEHTRSIVRSRLIRERNYEFLTMPEAEQIRAIAVILTGDHRGPIIQYVISHVDEALGRFIGEADRKPGIPPAPEFIRDGLKLLDFAALRLFQGPFIQIGEDSQSVMLDELSREYAKPVDVWGRYPQKTFFKKLLRMTMDAYYSHPTVWSEIGYGGPAYPRGYIRTHPNHLDPWEAKSDGQ
ncbi:gluconate 2-dehydrogenase subunit 3 family protein [Paenibacillus turpanensis]|uniref:gluconate 2-dehydrogenase subunit 3 family protein n=1 Tax=Paenibacillus turpanensis TaxID=2689078 RepID=UPI00140E934F|nr:gluconate 2-dehydrogenase subunit 3 family protein [Paenibacillus turpanensis]